VDKVEALLKLLKAVGVNVGLVRVMGKLRLQIAQRGHSLLVQGQQRGRRGIDSLQLLQSAADGAGLGKQRSFVLAQ
jgi:hypothetical protein